MTLKGKISRLFVIGVLGVVAATGVGSAAFGAGVSGSVNGCYVQWWGKSWAAMCSPATLSGEYRAHVDRSAQTDYVGPWRYVGKNSNVTFDSGTATFAVNGKNTYVRIK